VEFLILRYHRYLLEHGLNPDGFIDPNATVEDTKSGSYETFFTETSNGKYVPRSIFVDLDPSVREISQMTIGDPQQLTTVAY
jgi:tubulin alpha